MSRASHPRRGWRNSGQASTAGLLLALLAGCFSGGGGDDPVVPPPPAANEIPDSALVSAEAYTRFALSVPDGETNEPLNVDKVVTPPVSDTTEPLPLS